VSDKLLSSFNFEVTLTRSSTGSEAGGSALLGNGGFQECNGLEVEMDVKEYLEGGRNDGVVRQVGRAKYTNLVLKRGTFYAEGEEVNLDLWRWLQDVVAGVRPVARFDGTVVVLDAARNAVATWTFERGLPAKIKGPDLNARTGEVAIEELHIAHEGLKLTRS
jgi:phage tail-like protein